MRTQIKKAFFAITAICAVSAGVLSQNSYAQNTISNNPAYAKIVGTASSGANIDAEVAFAVDLQNNHVLISKNSDAIRPIASITKLMTAYIITQSNLPMDQLITITDDDVDRVKNSGSRLTVGTTLKRAEMLHLALMSSENRAAHALARTYPGGVDAFVREMNTQARLLGMTRTRYIEPTGLSPLNVSTPRDLTRLISMAARQPLIHEFTTNDGYNIVTSNGLERHYQNSNRLIRNPNWKIDLSKTGYIKEAGKCLVMMTEIDNRPIVLVILNSPTHTGRFADAVKMRHILQNDYPTLL